MKTRILIYAMAFAMTATLAIAVEDGLGTNHVRTLKVYTGIELGGESITTWEDVSGSTLTNNSISTSMIQDGAVTEDKLSTSVAGDGLTGGAGTPLAVGAAVNGGITVNADDIQVDSTVVRTTGTQTIGGAKTFTGPVTMPAPTNTTDAATKAYVDDKLSSSIADGAAASQTLRWDAGSGSWTNTAGLTVDASGNTAVGGTLGVTGAATLSDTTTSTTTGTGALVVGGGAGIAENLNVGGNTDITGTLDVTGDSTLGAVDLTGNITFTGSAVSDLAMGANKITGLAAPTAGTDAAHKTYVDNAINGLSWKKSVRAISVANISVATAPANIDDVPLSAGDRILLKDQSTAAENGIYVFASAGNPMTRAADMTNTVQLAGAAVFGSQGTENGGSAWVCTSPAAALPGGGAISFTQFASPGTYTAGDGLNLNGLDFSVNATNLFGAGLEEDGANNLRIAATAAGDGLTGGGGNALAVDAGAGLTFDGNQVVVDTTVVRTTGPQTIGGAKTFTGSVTMPAPTNTTDAATKEYVDDKLSSSVADGAAASQTLRWDDGSGSWTNTAGLTVDASGNTAVGGTLGVTGAATLSDTTTSTTTGTGALVVGGGAGIAENLNVGGTAAIAGVTTLSDTTASTDKDTGALIVEGGVGVEGNINAGGNIDATGTLTVDGNTTLGDAIATDTVTLNAKTTMAGAVVLAQSAVLDIAVTGITAAQIQQPYLRVRGDGGAIDITANPQISTTGAVAGQMLTLQGTADDNPLKLDNGTGLSLDGGISFTLKNGHLIQFIFDGSVWRETFRTVPAP